MDRQQLAKKEYDSLSFFLVPGLPKGSEAGIDGKVWQVDKFEGFKLIPPGLHFFIVSAAPTTKSQSSPGAFGVRHGLFRFFASHSETVVEGWGNSREEFESQGDERAAKRRRTLAVADGAEGATAGTVISSEYLKGLDKHLAAYPAGLEKEWRALSSYITPETLARVIGLTPDGNAITSAVTGSTADEEELKAAGGRQTWGKSREANVETVLDEGEDDVETLAFVRVDLKRSWPKGAVGEDLTRWSKDKSWLMSNIVKVQLGGDVMQLLAEFELSFTLFTLLHNFSSLAVYKSLFALFARSSTLLLPPAKRPSPTSESSSSLLKLEILPFYVCLLTVFHAQIAFLDDAFFSEQMPGLDTFLLTELDLLREALSDAAREWPLEGGPPFEVWKLVVAKWDALTALVMERFGWEVGVIRGTKSGFAGGQIRRDPDEVDIEELEEGEDAPVFVEM
ncbi:hypothetical protein RQP46_000715 [Phenoliferia psychrophenolica]